MTREMSWEQVITIVLLVALLVVLAPILYNLGISATAQSERAQCEISVQANILAESVTRGLVNPFDINCARRSILVEEPQARIYAHNTYERVTRTTPYTYDVATTREGVDVRVPSAQRLRTDSEKLADDIVDALAYEATSCWQLLNEGRTDIISSESLLGKTLSCVVCAEMTINTGQDFRKSIDLQEVLKQTPPHINNHHASIDSYLYTDTNPSYAAQCGPYAWNNQELIIEEGETYVVAFYRAGSQARWLLDRTLTQGSVCQAVTITTARDLARECVAMMN